MKNVLTIMRKEFARFFKDKRLVLGTLILPGVLIFAVYTLMGSAFNDSTQTYTVKVVHSSSAFVQMFETGDGGESVFSFEEAEEEDADAICESIRSGDVDALVVLPENFDAILAGGQFLPSGSAPEIQIFYDSTETSSYSAYNAIASVLTAFESAYGSLYSINFTGGGDLTSAQEASAEYYAMLLPFLVLVFLYSGCMGIAPESIAGEKERGTIATLLVTPIRRSELVVGKILSLSALSVLSAVSSFIGTFLSLPKLMGQGYGDAFAAYSVGQYFALFAVMITAVLLIVTLISILSSLARSVKEATTYAVPLMILVMLVGVSSMFFGAGGAAWPVFLIPVYNIVQVMAEIFSLRFSVVHFLITAASNLVYVVLLVLLLAKMFNNEKIIFNK